jgi:hypothetical protein
MERYCWTGMMPTISLGNSTKLASHVSDGMFGGNLLFDRDRISSGTYDEAVDALNIKSLRYPGGTITEQYFDIKNPNAQFATEFGTGNNIDLLPLSDFMNFSALKNLKPTIVIPTGTALSEGPLGTREVDPVAVDDIRVFVKTLLHGDFGNVDIQSFEIGNEYWLGGEMTAVEYGKVASAISLAIQDEIDAFVATNSVSTNWTEPVIAVQMGNYGQFSTEPGWLQNKSIMAEFNSSEAAAVDAVVGHFYIGDGFEGVNDKQWFFDRLNEWNNNSKFSNLDAYVTEWNTDFYLSSDTGLLQAATMLNMFAEMVSQGIDSAWVWPVQQNTKNDLFGDEGDTNITFGGEIFTLLSRNVAASVLVQKIIEPNYAIFEFDKPGESVIFVINRTDVSQQLNINIDSNMISFSYLVSTVLASNGEANNQNASPLLTIDTTPDFFGQELVSNLSAFEIGMYVLTDESVGVEIYAQNSLQNPLNPNTSYNDSLVGSTANDQLFGYVGDDFIFSGDGMDTVHGGDGSDTIDGGGMADLIFGGGGGDVVFGGNGNDTVYLGDGNDIFEDNYQSGQFGSDTVFGESGNDELNGRWGDDYIDGGDGNDLIFGGQGNDTLLGGSGFDTIRGGEGDDEITISGGTDQVFGELGNDVINYVSGVAQIFGGGGYDTLNFSSSSEGVSLGSNRNILIQGQLVSEYADVELVIGSGFQDRIGASGAVTTVRGGDGNDYIWSENKPGNSLFGENGDDYITIEGDGSVAYGGSGNDTILGGESDITIFGGDGDDWIRSSSKNSELTGGAGADTFWYMPFSGSGMTTIHDFQIGVDSLGGFNQLLEMDYLVNHSAQVGNDVVFDIDGTSFLLIENLDLPDFYGIL